ncbi:hypothetical protein Tsubulata_015832 [Turnera subulata]|uniref:non-specific serine/threonine protein kinase n=1 Tax=Turnera subulata TaxID=218843 RepID=A0A9Q0GDI4_9ROSI|nr:hypothetical protein Tsubulata_015832 [Turnera subulata]
MQQERAIKSFDAECEVLSNIRHRNLVKIISSCTNRDFKALILEYMANGSLEKLLYSHNYSLDILQRLNIMIDVASGLDYLHHGYSRAVVHCDLKPSNVLLDSGMTAHVSDLGIAKLLGEEDSMAQTKTLATVGYMAPEYGSEGIVSTRGDVYSFGILLMETFTRKKPTDEMFREGMSLKDYVQKALPDSVAKLVDERLLSEESHLLSKIKCLTSIFTLAMDCVIEFPEQRTYITEVLATLKNIRTRYLADTTDDVRNASFPAMCQQNPRLLRSAQSNISSIDQNALLALKSHITYDPNNFLATNWSTKTSVCSWIGVYYLSNNRFTGQIPSGFGSFANLEVLVLDKNRLSGIIPPSICNVSTLRSLSLRENALRGNIAEVIGRLANLETLDLYDNPLSGPIPMSAFNMSSLMTMKLGRNRVNGSLPDDICQNLPNLTWFFIGPNEIVGKIPNGLWKCKKLVQFIVGYNKLTGSIPKVLANLTQLEELQLDSNYLTGEIPEELGSLYKLKKLTLTNNPLKGSIPRSLANCTMLIKNGLTGTIPAYIGEFSSLERLYLWGNELRGNIPISIGNASRLTLLQLSRNAFSGPVPSSLGNLRQLQRLNLGRNNLTNLSFISSMANCKKLISFQLGFNQFNNILPASIGNLSASLQVLHLKSCKIKGSIPGEIGNLSSLTKLTMADNELTGPVPTTIGRLKKLQDILRVNLSSNSLSGQLPLSIGNLKVIAMLELSNNNFSEYGLEGIVSTRGDVYSFGILLMETLTRKKPTDEMFGEGMSLKDYVNKALPDSVATIVDKHLLSEEEHPSAKIKCISSIFTLAMDCVVEFPEKRPDMTEVLATLRNIRTRYLADKDPQLPRSGGHSR